MRGIQAKRSKTTLRLLAQYTAMRYIVIQSLSDTDAEVFSVHGLWGKEMGYRIEREPTTPGEILQQEFLTPLGFTQRQFAGHIGCDVKVINRIVNGRTSVGAEMAVKLSASLRTTPEFWLNAQQAVDIYKAEKKLKKRPGPLVAAS